MKKTIKISFSFIALLMLVACNQNKNFKNNEELNGLFLGEVLTTHEGVKIPVRVLFIKNEAFFVNDVDTVKAELTKITKDSVVIKPMLYNTVINLKKSHDSLIGFLVHLDINRQTPIFLTSDFNKQQISISKNRHTQILNKQWKATFIDGETKKQSIASFKVENNYLSGNFRTETGDYRFLQGNILNDKLWLSTFDGAHVYYFNADIVNDSIINGSFYFGPKKVKKVELILDEKFKLADPTKITSMLNPDEKFDFTALNLQGGVVSFSSLKSEAKITIIQIMGSWCPNCMDETNFFTQLYTKYHQKGLDIVGVTFERSEELSKAKSFIDRMIDNLHIEYPIYFGGKPKAENTKKVFSQLNFVKSYPTTIFLDENHKVLKIHTGFNGPATGNVYKEYEKEVIALIEANL